MFRIVERRGVYFLFSLALTLPCIFFMIWSATTRGTWLPLSIDYTGGSLWEMRFAQPMQLATVRQALAAAGHTHATVFHVEDDRTVQVKFESVTSDRKEVLEQQLTEQLGAFEELAFRSLGPTVGEEVGHAALLAVLVASVLILCYIWMMFRQVSHPFRYGACAVVALIHDVLIILSFVCVMNLIAGWEIDALFLTAVLTVIGYSVNDTIVIFDRIRENFKRYPGMSLALLANRSIVETLIRSVGTGITTLLTLVAVLVLGGPTLRQFAATLIVGILAGTYSSIFNAAALLVAWDEHSLLHRKQPAPPVAGKAAVV